MKKSGWILLLLFLTAAAMGQHRDAQLWTGISVRYEPFKKWRISLDEEARFFNNISKLDKINSELTINYQISKFLDGGILYRLISNQEPGGNFDFNNRFGVYLSVQKKIGKWSGSFKTSFQKTYPEYRRTREWYIPENYVRAVAEIAWESKKKKTEPYTNIEYWYRITPGDQGFVDQYRWTIGIKQKLSKRHRVDVFFRLQQEMQVKDPLFACIIGIGYGFTVRK